MQPDYLRTVMPSVFVPEDAVWIQEQMVRLPAGMRQTIAIKYAEVYEETFDSEPVSHRKENRARHEANTRLRLYVDHRAKAAAGLTSKPPMAV